MISQAGQRKAQKLLKQLQQYHEATALYRGRPRLIRCTQNTQKIIAEVHAPEILTVPERPQYHQGLDLFRYRLVNLNDHSWQFFELTFKDPAQGDEMRHNPGLSRLPRGHNEGEIRLYHVPLPCTLECPFCREPMRIERELKKPVNDLRRNLREVPPEMLVEVESEYHAWCADRGIPPLPLLNTSRAWPYRQVVGTTSQSTVLAQE